MLSPKRSKYRKQHKGRIHGLSKGGTELNFGSFGLKALDWDGVSDSIYHPFDLGGRRHMEYLGYRGVFADIPFAEIRGAFRHYYPRMTRAQEEMPLGGDFGAEGALEATRK